MKNTQFKLGNPVHFLALGFGSGLLKPAPGTWGTLAAIPIYLLVVCLLREQSPTVNLAAYSTVVVLAFFLGVYLCGKTASDVGVHDHSAIVWDEIVGYLVTLWAVTPNLATLAVGFLLFRLFDILKPWPIRVLDKRVHHGFGIMIDDVLAGVFACVILHLLQPYLMMFYLG